MPGWRSNCTQVGPKRPSYAAPQPLLSRGVLTQLLPLMHAHSPGSSGSLVCEQMSLQYFLRAWTGQGQAPHQAHSSGRKIWFLPTKSL